MGLSWSVCLPRLRCLMNSAMPPLYLNSVRLASLVFESVWRSSVRVMTRPLLRNANSRRRCESVSKLYSPPPPGVSSADILTEQVELNAQITTLRLLLQGALSDQYVIRHSRPVATRKQTTLGFTITRSEEHTSEL